MSEDGAPAALSHGNDGRARIGRRNRATQDRAAEQGGRCGPLGNLGFARHGLSLNLELRPYGESGGPSALRQVMRSGGSGGSADGVSGIHTASAIWPIHSENVATMSDPILEEIWRVREQLIQRHGGV